MSRRVSLGWILAVVFLTSGVASSLIFLEPPRPGIRVELEPDAADAAELEKKVTDRVPPWRQRWERNMEGRVDATGRTPAEALRQARAYDRTMPIGAGPEAVRSTRAVNQTVPGDAWRSLGPESTSGTYMDVSGRIRGLVVVHENLLYVGAAGGGVWKWEYHPIEQIETWTPLSDFEDSLAIGTLAIDRQDTQILYAGTGEVGNGGSSYAGVGVLRTTDGGNSWDTLGTTLFNGKRISTIAVDPRTVANPKTGRILWVASTAGLYRSTDSGDHFNLIAAGDFTDVVLDPYNPDLVFAAQQAVGLWKIDMNAGGTPSPIVDGGGQLPTQHFGRVRLAAVKDGQNAFTYLYASMQDTYDGRNLKGIWSSPDHGLNWTRVTGHPRQFADGMWANANLLESESNDTVGSADVVPANQTVQGHISSGSDVDIFRFTLSGRDSFNAEILAERAGSGLNARISLLDATGNPVMRGQNPYTKNGDLKNTAKVATHDSRMLTGWNTMTPGAYHLKVESEDGSTGQYQLSILGIDLWCQCEYDQALTVDPDDPDTIYMGLISFFRTTNGGADWTEIQDHAPGNWVHQDIQVIARHPTDPNTIYVGSDGGLWRSEDRGDTWISMNTDGLRITQPIKASIHPTDPGFILLGNQDNGSAKLESGVWTELEQGDGGTNAVISSAEYYYSSQNGWITKVYPGGVDDDMRDNGLEIAGSAFHSPFVVDPNNSQVLLAGGGSSGSNFRVYRTINGAQSWNPEGAALPRHVLALAFAPSDSSVYYVGTNTPGPEIWRVGSTGTDWDEITWPNIPNAPISDIEVAAANPDWVYVSFERFGGGSVFRSTNAGQGWDDIGRTPHSNPSVPQGISQTPLPDVPVEAIVVDPVYPNTIWVGTDLGVYRTLDGGVNWHKFGYKLPNAGIRDLVLSPTSGGTGRLIAATHGRGVWELYTGNDSCDDAELISDGFLAGTTLGATADGASTCSGDTGGPSVWYEYVATCDGKLTVDTCGSSFDTLISVHSTGCPGDQGTEVVCNDDCLGGCGNGNSCAVTQVSQGNTYMIRVAGYQGAAGNFQLDVSCDLPNETCDNADPVAPGQIAYGSTRGGLWDAAPTCNGFDQTAAGVWYTVQGTGNLITASTCGNTDYDTRLSVYCSGCVGQQCINADDDSCGTDAEVSWCSAPGVTYDVLVHGYQQQEGSFGLQVTDGAYCGPFYLSCSPANDECDYAQSLSSFGAQGDNTDAGTGPAPSCRATSGDVWYDFEPICHGFATLGTCGSAGSLTDTVLAVYDECGGVERACNDDACGTFSQVVVPTRPGGAMRIQVADYFGNGVADEGTFSLDVSSSITLVTTPWPGLYAADGSGSVEDHLLRIDRDLENYIDVGVLGAAGVEGLAWASGLGLMYGINDSIDTDELVLIDPDTGAATSVGASGYVSLRGLAWDPDGMVLYSTELWSGNLVEIDPYTGAGATVGPTGFAEVEGLAFDTTSGKLYGSDIATDQLIEIDTATGAGTVVGPFGVGFNEIHGLTFDSARGELLGSQVDGGGGRLARIDRVSGLASWIIETTMPEAQLAGLAYVEELPEATVGQPYDAQIPVAGGCPSYWFSSTSGQPPGLTVDAHGKVTGIPTASGVYTILYFVDDSDLSTASVPESFPIVVRPMNDRCEDAIWLTSGAYQYSTFGAVTDGPDEPGVCDFFNSTEVESDVWFRWVADCTGDLTVETCGSGFDTKVAVYDELTCPSVPSADACDDDGTCSPGSELAMPVRAGEAYLIRIGGYGGAQGHGSLSLQCAGLPAGGCCANWGCSLLTFEECVAADGVYLGDGTTCGADVDADGMVDSCDGCPVDAAKFEPGICGCSVADFDTDGDGQVDCVDLDIDGDAVDNGEDLAPLDRFRCRDLDGDGCDDCASGSDDPGNDGTDSDGDGWCDVGDCAVLDGGAVHLPGEVVELRFDPGKQPTWDPPAQPGGAVVLYDTLRTLTPADFTVAQCIETDGSDLFSPAGSDPLHGQPWYYLVRAGNACGEGTLGFEFPLNFERPGSPCP